MDLSPGCHKASLRFLLVGTSRWISTRPRRWRSSLRRRGATRWTGHTGAQVRVAAYGSQAANVNGLLDQTDVHYIIKRALNLK